MKQIIDDEQTGSRMPLIYARGDVLRLFLSFARNSPLRMQITRCINEKFGKLTVKSSRPEFSCKRFPTGRNQSSSSHRPKQSRGLSYYYKTQRNYNAVMKPTRALGACETIALYIFNPRVRRAHVSAHEFWRPLQPKRIHARVQCFFLVRNFVFKTRKRQEFLRRKLPQLPDNLECARMNNARRAIRKSRDSPQLLK